MLNKTLIRVISKYGKKAQTLQAIQELGELIVALTKGDVKDIEDEIADVEIMIDQLKYMYVIDTTQRREFKLNRLEDRLNTGGKV